MRVHIVSIAYVLMAISSKPTHSSPVDRKAKSLYFDYIPQDYGYFEDSNNYINEDLARTITSTRRNSNAQKVVPSSAFNSPIYYIALPPQPYIFVPGMGYMSQPPPNPAGEFLNLPVNFVANGKPNNIYQWSGGFNLRPGASSAVQKPVEKPKPTDSPVINLDNKFVFDGKPDSISVLRDSYNALYSDALQNFYP